MATGIHLFSQTASSNATADSSINWAEGQAPSSVNDSARALMARLADYYKDIGGLTTGGSSTAYTVTTNRAFASAAVMAGSVITIIPHATNGAAATLAVDSLTARAINTVSGTAVPAGALLIGIPYQVLYVHGSTEFVLLAGAGATPSFHPPGMIVCYAGITAPTAWQFCFGQSLLRTDQPALFAAIGTTYGASDANHFTVPDMRGRSPFGRDDMGGSTASRLTTFVDGVTMGATGGVQTVTLAQANLPNATMTVAGNLTNGSITVGGAVFDTQSVRADLSQVNVLRTGGNALGITASLASTALTGTTSSINGNTTQTVINSMPPAVILNWIIKT